MKILLPILLLLAGMGSAAMIAMNARFKETIASPPLTVALAFAFGSALMLVFALTGLMGRGDFGKVAQAPWWAYCGGLLSAGAVLVALFAKSESDTAFIAAATVFGQLLMGAAIDHFGWFESKQQSINAWKIGGIVLMCVGAILMGKK